MANNDRPRGLQPYGEIRRALKYEAGGTIRAWDPVALAADGTVSQAQGTEGTPGVIHGVATHRASTGEDVLVSTDPEQLYVCQANGSEIAAQAGVGQTADLVNATPSPDFGESQTEVDTATASAGSSAQVVILGKDEREDNAYGDKVDLLVKINENQIYGERGSSGI